MDPRVLIGVPAWGVNELYGWDVKVIRLTQWAANAFVPKNQRRRP